MFASSHFPIHVGVHMYAPHCESDRMHAFFFVGLMPKFVLTTAARVWGRVGVAGGQGAGGQKKSKKKKEKRDENEYCGGGEGGTHGRLLQTS